MMYDIHLYYICYVYTIYILQYIIYSYIYILPVSFSLLLQRQETMHPLLVPPSHNPSPPPKDLRDRLVR